MPNNIVILISGSGSNMAAIARAAERRRWHHRYAARVSAVISNRGDAAGLALARELGIATAVVAHADHADRESFEQVLAAQLDAHRPALVVLAGFMRILGPRFVAKYAGRMLNIHPSLLPAFPGLHTHRRVIEAGCRVSGATVHEVTAELDHGRILGQCAVPVMPGDTPATLSARVLAHEHRLYPQAIESWLQSRSVAHNPSSTFGGMQ